MCDLRKISKLRELKAARKSDTECALALGVSITTVTDYRKRFDIPTARFSHWRDRNELKRLLTEGIAIKGLQSRMNVGTTTITLYRKELGIRHRAWRSKHHAVTDIELINLIASQRLSGQHDEDIAESLGAKPDEFEKWIDHLTDLQARGLVRAKLVDVGGGVPVPKMYAATTPSSIRDKQTRFKTSDLVSFLNFCKIQLMSDTAIGFQLGVHYNTVARYRHMLGIGSTNHKALLRFNPKDCSEASRIKRRRTLRAAMSQPHATTTERQAAALALSGNGVNAVAAAGVELDVARILVLGT